MNFAHMVGEHHFESQSENFLHTAVSWTPFIIGMLLAMAVIYYIARKRQNLITERIKTRRK